MDYGRCNLIHGIENPVASSKGVGKATVFFGKSEHSQKLKMRIKSCQSIKQGFKTYKTYVS